MKKIIDKSEVKALSDNIEGKLVVIEADYFKPPYRDAKYQLVVATGGFGCYVGKRGSAVYVIECCENPEDYRQERFCLIGEPTEELVQEWKEIYGEFNEKVLKYLEEHKENVIEK